MLIGAGGFSRQSATEAISAGTVDAVAFGRLFISNPDLPLRLQRSAPLNRYDRPTFYGGGIKGYSDYPALNDPPALDDTHATQTNICEVSCATD